MNKHYSQPQGDPRILPEDSYNDAYNMESHFKQYLKNYVQSAMTEQEILQRDEKNRMIATTGVGYKLKKKDSEGFIVGANPAQ